MPVLSRVARLKSPSNSAPQSDKENPGAWPRTSAVIGLVGHYSERYAHLLQNLLGDSVIVRRAADVDSGVELVTDPRSAVFVLDFTPPATEALGLLSELRSLGCSKPIVATLPRHDAERKQALIEAGVTDVFIWPFALGQLHRRCAELIERRVGNPPDEFCIGSLRLVSNSTEVFCGTQRLRLQKQQQALLAALIQQGGQVCAREYLASVIGKGRSIVTTNALHRTISRLRVNLDQLDTGVQLRSVRGLGYMLRENRR